MPPVETLSYVGVMAVMLFIMWKGYTKVTENHNRDVEKLRGEYDKIQRRLTIMETKQDIYLTELGYDVRKVNASIKEHMAEIESNDRPSVGCMDISKLKVR